MKVVVRIYVSLGHVFGGGRRDFVTPVVGTVVVWIGTTAKPNMHLTRIIYSINYVCKVHVGCGVLVQGK